MTKEDIKQICQIYDNFRSERDAATIAYNSDDTFWGHILATYNLSQPSLPSNIDEAAIPESEMDEWMKYGPHTNYPWCSIPDVIEITAEHFFALGKQAGAEWMAGQGVTKECIVGMATKEIVCTFTEETLNKLGVCPSDNLIIQIRKE